MPIKRTYRKDGKEQTFYYGRVTVNGKTYEQRCQSKKEATTWEVLVRQKLKESSGNVNPESHSIHSLLKLYLEACQNKGLSKGWVTEKKVVFEKFNRHIPPETPIGQISYLQVAKFLDRIAKDVSGYRANRVRRHIVAAYNWGIKALRLPRPCPWEVDFYKEVRKPRRIPSEAEFEAILENASTEKKRLLLTYLYTAARRDEILTLKWQDVDLERRRMTLWTNKRSGGREFDVIPIIEPLYNVLQEQRKETAFKGYVFINPETGDYYKTSSRIMGRLCAAADVSKFDFHSIRHLSSSMMAKAGVPLPIIQAILRHKTAVTTSKYLHSLEGVSGMADSLNNVFDLNKKLISHPRQQVRDCKR